MSFVDCFTPETKIEVKFADFFSLVKEAAKAELMMNAVNCNVPNAYIREIMTGTQEETPEQQEIKAINATILANAAKLEERDIEKIQEDRECEKENRKELDCKQCGNYRPNAIGEETSSHICKACKDGRNFIGKDEGERENGNA